MSKADYKHQDKYYIVTQLATGGELFDRICDKGRFTEKDGSQTIKQVLEAVDCLHSNNVVHRGNSTGLYVTRHHLTSSRSQAGEPPLSDQRTFITTRPS